MTMTNKTAAPLTVISRETGKRYTVLREYRDKLMVRPAWKRGGFLMTMPRSAFRLV